jgi:nitroimidazol reductase NimA-like FMN-containing flavoprotein (pyridoxamine 5'-phosphate oxidase superfamily)
MEKAEELEHLLQDLFRSQKLAVLATHNSGQPYASLVAFAATGDLKKLVFATTRSTRKYANITGDHRVAVLVDSRSNQVADIHAAMAVTATGRARELFEGDREKALHLYLSKHPHLGEFVGSPTCTILGVEVDTYYLVRQFQKVLELHMTP